MSKGSEIEQILMESWFVINITLGKQIKTSEKQYSQIMSKTKPNKQTANILGVLCFMVSELAGDDKAPAKNHRLLFYQICLTAKVLNL